MLFCILNVFFKSNHFWNSIVFLIPFMFLLFVQNQPPNLTQIQKWSSPVAALNNAGVLWQIANSSCSLHSYHILTQKKKIVWCFLLIYKQNSCAVLTTLVYAHIYLVHMLHTFTYINVVLSSCDWQPEAFRCSYLLLFTSRDWSL